MVGRYYARTNDIARALYHYEVLMKIDPDHPVTQLLANEIIAQEFQKLRQEMAKQIFPKL